MNISPDEAEEALASIQKVMQKTRHSVASSGANITLLITGIVWLIGYVCTQFLSGPVVAYIWIGLSVLGSIAGAVLGSRLGKRVRSPLTGMYARRIGIFWLLIILYAIAAIAIAHPTDGKQFTMLILLFIMVGHMGMGLLLSFASTWWAIPVTVLALIGYFLFPGIFYLWIGALGGGGMIALALYIRSRW